MGTTGSDSRLDGHHRATLERIFAHPTSHNLQWHDVLALLERVGTVEERHEGRFSVTVGSENQMFDVLRHRDLDDQQVVDLRRMLSGAGYAPGEG